ncbi:transcriptional regulator FtrA [Novosphingobium beihaiensis]|uniref:Transcriptional regulator FtrA n=1 Tax=Novosphingobium beihaiensis TaxID=2930389 RepID=A0ABT0BLQ3_9SPHN|nr:transcriptional regulator FtrA [Novosphingobium beihaiensis]MCJ2185991.1 transcriptional regulator FtrA [Novosphingobium beihaiensis]
MPKRSSTTGPLVAVLVYDGLTTFEFGCAYEVFGLRRDDMGPDWYRFATVAAEPGPVRGRGGITVHPDGGLDLMLEAHTLVLPGWCGPGVKASVPLLEALRRAHARGVRIVSICGGTFVLAQAGLLTGRRVTTHWMHLDRLAQEHPDIEVDPHTLYADDGDILTSAGSAAGLDLCLHIVRKDFGARAANSVARRLVIAPHRDGGQSQFVQRPLVPPSGRQVSALLDTIRGRLGEAWPVERMAQEARVSVRSVQRHIRDATGLPPGEWLQSERLAHARDLLEETRLSIETVAAMAGFGTATNFRQHFRAAVGLPPAAYRIRFHAGIAS